MTEQQTQDHGAGCEGRDPGRRLLTRREVGEDTARQR
jgi:hypothetical protein